MNSRERQPRSDKKIGINPILPTHLYESLYRLSYICNCSVKEIGETLVLMGLNSKEVIDSISHKFRRGYEFRPGAHWYMGDMNRVTRREVIGPEQHRIALRFYKLHYEKLKLLSFAMDTALTKGTATLIEASYNNHQCLANLLAKYVKRDLDPRRLQHLRYLWQTINNSNGRRHEDVSIPMLVYGIYTTIGTKVRRLSEAVMEWLDEVEDE